MEFIKVSDNKKGFCTEGGSPFYPFGGNFIFDCEFTDDPSGEDRQNLNILVKDKWRPDIIKKAFISAKEAGLNIMKVFMSTPMVLTEEKGHASIRKMTPDLFERLDFIFEVAHETEIYISLTLSEWGMGGCGWFHDGGEFFGSPADNDAELDSFKIYEGFWKLIASRYRDEPALFCYNLGVELYIPSANWGADKGGDDYPIFTDRYGERAFRAWLERKYGSISKLNEAWRSSYAGFSEIKQPSIRWYPSKGRYNIERRIISDYNDFKECAVYLFLKNQADAIRSVDQKHMISAGLHPDQNGMQSKGFGSKVSGLGIQEYDFFDFVTLHIYMHIDYLISRPVLPPVERHSDPYMMETEDWNRRLLECSLFGRYCRIAGKPVLIEEYGHNVTDEQECYEGALSIVEELSKSCCGFMYWCFGRLQNYETGEYIPGIIDTKLNVTEFGRKFAHLKDVAEQNYAMIEQPAKTIVYIDRDFGNAPDKESVGEKIVRCPDAYSYPIDFVYPKNEELEKYRRLNLRKIY